jgi:hypothetical protein
MMVPTALLSLNGKAREMGPSPELWAPPVDSTYSGQEVSTPQALLGATQQGVSAVSAEQSLPQDEELRREGPYRMRKLAHIDPPTTTIHGQFPADVSSPGSLVMQPANTIMHQHEEAGARSREALWAEYALVTVPPSFSVCPLLHSTPPKRNTLRRQLYDRFVSHVGRSRPDGASPCGCRRTIAS